MKKSPFFKQADLVLRLLPHLHEEGSFALHGGTAINFFVRDMPRLSVDIDLTYLPIEDRETTLANISKKLQGLAKKFRKALPGIQITEKEGGKRLISKLILNYQNAVVVIEPNLIMRGTVFPLEDRDISRRAEKEFEKFVTVKSLSVAALYGGKICAALSRQHPRDLFDIKLLFENEGFTAEIRKAFLVCLLCSNRPMNELLNPRLKDQKKVFESEFSGMALIPVTYTELESVRKKMIKTIREGLQEKDRKFLVSFKEGKPDWGLLGIESVDKLPAVQWKLTNLAKMDRKKHLQAISLLKKTLEK